MEDEPLPPETLVNLHIHMDRLNRTAEQCRNGLRQIAGGRLSRRDYREVLERHLDAQRAWEAKLRETFCKGD
jgi:hypothetical protein